MKDTVWERPSQPPSPEPCGGNPQGVRRSVGRGTREAGIELRNRRLGDAQPVRNGEGNTDRSAMARIAVGSHAVRDPVRMWRPFVLEPGAPVYACQSGRPSKGNRTGGVYGTGSHTGVMYR